MYRIFGVILIKINVKFLFPAVWLKNVFLLGLGNGAFASGAFAVLCRRYCLCSAGVGYRRLEKRNEAQSVGIKPHCLYACGD